MKDLISNLSILEQILIIVNFISLITLTYICLLNKKKIRKLVNKYNKFMKVQNEENLENMLENHLEILNEIRSKSKEFECKLNYIERNLLQCVQKIGLVRYTAFENVGSDLSFAIALLDNYDSGIVINGVYSREGSSTYAKSIIAGKSKYPLSAEEIQALDIAKRTYRERLYTE